MKLFKTGRFYFLQPLAYMEKDYNDSFKPFKSPYYIKRDFLQPYHGAVNIFNGCKDIGHGIGHLEGARIALGLTNIFRGLTRIVTTPLTWLIRMPLRGLITAIKGFQKAESSSGIQNAVDEGRTVFILLKHCNESISTLTKLHQLKQEITDGTVNPQQQRVQAAADPHMRSLHIMDGKFELNQKEVLAKANEVADTISRKYQKARERGQATDLPLDIEPLNVTQDESKKFVTGPFIAGLRLFDTDKSTVNALSWKLHDTVNNSRSNR